MRWILLAVLLAGCDAAELVTDQQAPSAPAPVTVPAGTLVAQTWQFTNRCDFVLQVLVMKDELRLAGRTAQPGDTISVEIRCAVGDEIRFDTARDGQSLGQDSGPCAPGVMPPRVACR